jgi:tetratricopeptide (TPR) repeat protein
MLAQSVLSDPGAREHLRARVSATEIDELISRSMAAGLDVFDIRPFSGHARRVFRWQYIVIRTLVITAGLALVLVPSWPLAVRVTLATLLLAGQGLRLAWLMEWRGAPDPTVDRSPRARLIDAVAYALRIAAIVLVLLVIDAGGRLLAEGRGLAGLGVLTLGTVLLRYVHLLPRELIRRGRTWVAGDGGFGAEADRSSVLFLRSFADDTTRLLSAVAISGPAHPLVAGGQERLEELVATTVQAHSGRLVAIGRPGERLPELGSARTYYPDEQWQDAVRATAARCRAIVLVAGRTEGLGWELQHLRDWGLLSKTLVLLPPEPDDAQARRRLTHVLDHVGGNVPDEWLPVLWVGLTFPQTGTRIVVSDGRDWASFTTAITAYLSDLEGKVDVSRSRTPRADDVTFEEALERAGSEGAQRLGPMVQSRLQRSIAMGLQAVEAGDRSAEEKHFGAALETAAGSGVVGAPALVHHLWATGLVEAGRHGDARRELETLLTACARPFPRFRYLGGEQITAEELRLDGLQGLATLAGDHGVGDPQAAFRAWYAGMVAARRWAGAGEIATVLGRNATSAADMDSWFTNALEHRTRIGDTHGVSRVELEWGRALVAKRATERGREHLERARALADQALVPELVAEAEAEIADLDAAPRTNFFDAFADRARRLVVRATEAARARGDVEVRPQHLLLALAQDDEGNVARQALLDAGVSIDGLITRLHADLGEPGHAGLDRVPFSPELKALLRRAAEAGRARGDGIIGPTDLLAALATDATGTGSLLAEQGYDDAARSVSPHAAASPPSPATASAPAPSQLAASAPAPRQTTASAPVPDPAPAVSRPTADLSLLTANPPTLWDLGGISTMMQGTEHVRPEGMIDEPVTPRERTVLRAVLLAGWYLRVLGLRLVSVRLVTWWLHRRGAHATAAGLMLSEAAHIARKRPAEGAAITRDALAISGNAWITIGDDPVTGFEVQDSALEQLGLILGLQGDKGSMVAMERRRLELAPHLRAPRAVPDAHGRLAIELARAGAHAEADTQFRIYADAGRPAEGAVLIWAASALERGDLDAAREHLATVESLYEGDGGWAGAWGLRGDIACAAGDRAEARRCWERGLELARELHDIDEGRLLTMRLGQL